MHLLQIQLHVVHLNQAVTEFGVQGLELDMPIVGWGLT